MGPAEEAARKVPTRAGTATAVVQADLPLARSAAGCTAALPNPHLQGEVVVGHHHPLPWLRVCSVYWLQSTTLPAHRENRLGVTPVAHCASISPCLHTCGRAINGSIIFSAGSPLISLRKQDNQNTCIRVSDLYSTNYIMLADFSHRHHLGGFSTIHVITYTLHTSAKIFCIYYYHKILLLCHVFILLSRGSTSTWRLGSFQFSRPCVPLDPLHCHPVLSGPHLDFYRFSISLQHQEWPQIHWS